MRPIWLGGLLAPLAAPVALFFAVTIINVANVGWST
jgi:hypothetical protein